MRLPVNKTGTTFSVQTSLNQTTQRKRCRIDLLKVQTQERNRIYSHITVLQLPYTYIMFLKLLRLISMNIHVHQTLEPLCNVCKPLKSLCILIQRDKTGSCLLWLSYLIFLYQRSCIKRKHSVRARHLTVCWRGY